VLAAPAPNIFPMTRDDDAASSRAWAARAAVAMVVCVGREPSSRRSNTPSHGPAAIRAGWAAPAVPRRGPAASTHVAGGRSSRHRSRVSMAGASPRAACASGRAASWSKARVVKLRGTASKAAQAHLRYLQRDGATLDGERPPPVPPHRGARGRPRHTEPNASTSRRQSA
jgi:hypothetical protein